MAFETMNVLVVNKNAELALFMGLVLHQCGYAVSLADSVGKAHAQLSQTPPDLLILSEQQMDADLEALNAIKAARACQFILLSDALHSMQDAPDPVHFLPFPFRPRDLVARVDAALRFFEPPM